MMWSFSAHHRAEVFTAVFAFWHSVFGMVRLLVVVVVYSVFMLSHRGGAGDLMPPSRASSPGLTERLAIAFADLSGSHLML